MAAGGFPFALKNSYLCFKPEPVSLELPIISASLLNEFPVFLEGSDMASRRVYLTTRYHQTSPLPHSASFLPKHNQLIRSTREMRLVCKALKATFGKSQRPIISGKPTETPYYMGHRGMAKFPRGSTWPTRLILERDKPLEAIQSMPLIIVGNNQCDSVCYTAQSHSVQSRYTSSLLTTHFSKAPKSLLYLAFMYRFNAYHARRILSTFKSEPL